ncbi:MAG: hypothetical protein ACI8S6_003370 [Myxococcota bacterium]
MILKLASPLGFGGVRGASLLRIESGRLTEAENQEIWTDPVMVWDLTTSGELQGGKTQWSLGVRNLLDYPYGHPGGYNLIQAEVPQRGRNIFFELTRFL